MCKKPDLATTDTRSLQHGCEQKRARLQTAPIADSSGPPGSSSTSSSVAVRPTVLSERLATLRVPPLRLLEPRLHLAGERPDDRYPRAYTIAGTTTILAIVGGNVLVPGGLGAAPIIAVSLTTTGWLQASRGEPLAWIRAFA